MAGLGGKQTLSFVGWQFVANPVMRLFRLRHINARFA